MAKFRQIGKFRTWSYDESGKKFPTQKLQKILTVVYFQFDPSGEINFRPGQAKAVDDFVSSILFFFNFLDFIFR